MRAVLIGGAMLGLAACATDYTNGGNVVSRSTELQRDGVTITREYVTFADVIPGIATDHRNRWIARNSSGEPRCVRVTLSGTSGTGARRSGDVYLLQPGGGRQVVAYHQAAYGHPLGGQASGSVWRPDSSGCGNGPR